MLQVFKKKGQNCWVLCGSSVGDFSTTRMIFVVHSCKTQKFVCSQTNSRIRTLINGENFFYGIHDKSHNKNKIPVIVNVQIRENGTFPLSFVRITKIRIRKFSVLSLTEQPKIQSLHQRIIRNCERSFLLGPRIRKQNKSRMSSMEDYLHKTTS